MKIITIFLFLIIILSLAGCTAGINTVMDQPDPSGKVAGFWLGLWHGIIAPVTFFVSLFVDSISMYEVHNNGGWYDFGFVLGAGILFGGSGKASSRKS